MKTNDFTITKIDSKKWNVKTGQEIDCDDFKNKLIELFTKEVKAKKNIDIYDISKLAWVFNKRLNFVKK